MKGILIVLFCLTSFNAAAQCVVADMTGKWKTYGMLTDGASSLPGRLTLVFDQAGFIVATTPFFTVDRIQAGIIFDGRLLTNAKCKVAGTIEGTNIDDGTRFTLTVEHGWVDQTKTTMTGIATSTNHVTGERSFLFFTAVKK